MSTLGHAVKNFYVQRVHRYLQNNYKFMILIKRLYWKYVIRQDQYLVYLVKDMDFIDKSRSVFWWIDILLLKSNGIYIKLLWT